jgi:hypothetical protein
MIVHKLIYYHAGAEGNSACAALEFYHADIFMPRSFCANAMRFSISASTKPLLFLSAWRRARPLLMVVNQPPRRRRASRSSSRLDLAVAVDVKLLEPRFELVHRHVIAGGVGAPDRHGRELSRFLVGLLLDLLGWS